MDDNHPLIFVHYGFTEYLEPCLKTARKTNPSRDIYLIGDSSNEYLAEKLKIRFSYFDKHIEATYEKRLKNVYRHIGGEEFHKLNSSKGGQDWTYFNFLKWHVLFTFCQERGIKSFWTFDSDVLVVQDLSKFERNYSSYDYCTIPAHFVMQGFVSNILWLERFSEMTLTLFQDETYLASLSDDFNKNPKWGFTMMRVFRELKARENPNTVDLMDNNLEYSYDPCICIRYGNEELSNLKVKNTFLLKQLYLNTESDYLYRDSEGGGYTKLFAINMSWVPIYIIKRVISKSSERAQGGFREIKYDPYLVDHYRAFTDKVSSKLRYDSFRFRKFLGVWKYRLTQRIKISTSAKSIRLNVGNGATLYQDWFNLDLPYFDATDPFLWSFILGNKKASSILFEHVLEHLTENDVRTTLLLCKKHLEVDGRIRIAVPDSLHTNPEYIEYTRPGGSGLGADDHKSFWNFYSIKELSNSIGLKCIPLEYFDKQGNFLRNNFDQTEGNIQRTFVKSKEAHHPIQNYSSLIIDLTF